MTNPNSVNAFEKAVDNLRKFFIHRADHYSRTFNVHYMEAPDAPQDWEGIKQQFIPGKVVKVGTEGVETSLFGAGYEYALRFWHDALHVKLNADLSLAGELLVATAHLEEVEAAFGPRSLEVIIMAADAFGQTLFYRLKGGFVESQADFTLDFSRVMVNTDTLDVH